jgi:hypothetical protein
MATLALGYRLIILLFKLVHLYLLTNVTPGTSSVDPSYPPPPSLHPPVIRFFPTHTQSEGVGTLSPFLLTTFF